MSYKKTTPDYILPSGKIILSDKNKYAPSKALYNVYPEGRTVNEIFLSKNRMIDRDKVYNTLFMLGCKFTRIKGENKDELRIFLQWVNNLKVRPDDRLTTKMEKLIDEVMAKHKSVRLTPKLKKIFFSKDANDRIEKHLRSELHITEQVYMAEQITKVKQQISGIESGIIKREKTIADLHRLYHEGCSQKELVALSGKSIRTVRRYWSRVIDYIAPTYPMPEENTDENIYSESTSDIEFPIFCADEIIEMFEREYIPAYTPCPDDAI